MAKEADITAAQLRAILDYNPETGEFRWKKRDPDMHVCVTPVRSPEYECNRFNAKHAGKLAGHFNEIGYLSIHVLGRNRKASRLAWLLTTGVWPKKFMDHIDGNPSNNRFSNLREATAAQNCQNIRRPKNNTSGCAGVYFHKQSGRWRARIRVNRVHRSLGLFETKEAARAAVVEAKKRHHPFAQETRFAAP